MRSFKTFAFVAVASTLLVSAVQAQTATGWMKWMGVGGTTGQYSNSSTGPAQWNVFTSPYKAAFKIPVNPDPSLLPPAGVSSFGPTWDIYCVDFSHYANTGTSQTYFTNLGTGSSFLGTYTRSSSLTNYLATAYLAEQIKLDPTNAGLYNGAIWNIMSGEPRYWWNGSSWIDVKSTADFAQLTGYKSVNARDWVVVTGGTQNQTGGITINGQEFITHVTPEPATLLLLGTGLVVMLMAAGAFRRPTV